MRGDQPATPPRPITPGDIIATFSFLLDEWTAGQVITVDAAEQTVGVLELDWSGPEPRSVAEISNASPLILTHHKWNGSLSYLNHNWVLPRNYKVIGRLPLMRTQPSRGFGAWNLGDQLARQRYWNNGNVGNPDDIQRRNYTGAELNQLLAEPVAPDALIRQLFAWDVESLDCELLVQRFPSLTTLTLNGNLGILYNAFRLNELNALRSIEIHDLFSMTAKDCLSSDLVSELEYLALDGIPVEYAKLMRSIWRPEVPNGTYVDIRRPRKPEWIVEQRDNPLRDWDGRENISPGQYKRAVAHYKAIRQDVIRAFAKGLAAKVAESLVAIGRDYAERFNQLDSQHLFIDTEEREELFEALDRIANHAALTYQIENPQWINESLLAGLESARDW